MGLSIFGIHYVLGFGSLLEDVFTVRVCSGSQAVGALQVMDSARKWVAVQ